MTEPGTVVEEIVDGGERRGREGLDPRRRSSQASKEKVDMATNRG
jgi:hypothetical protein